jgi:hypothetical protein
MIHHRSHSDRVVSPLPPTDPEHQVIRFRPRGSPFPRRAPAPAPIDDLAKYERPRDEPDDYRHRMLMNGLATVAIVALVSVGLWIATTMAEIRKNQDCVLSGRSNCAPIPVPLEPR